MPSAIDVRRLLTALAAVLSSALLLWFGTGLNPLWPLLWFAPLPLLLFASRALWWAAGIAACAAWFLAMLSFWHYMVVVLQVPVVAFVSIFGIASLLFAADVLLYRALLVRRRYWSAVLAFPAAWVSIEFVNNVTSPHGTAGNLAYTQLRFLPFLQLASITGPWGISFLLLLFSAAIATGAYMFQRSRPHAWRIPAICSGVIALVLILGWVRLSKADPDPIVTVGMIATDQTRGVAPRGLPAERLLAEYAGKARELAREGAQVIVMPEKLAVVGDPEVKAVDASLQALADETKVPVIVGMVRLTGETKYNQARVYVPSAQVSTYDKQHMLPPFESDLKPGTELTYLTEGSGKWGVAICKDMDFSNPARQYGQSATGLLLVPAWDFVVDRSWHGHIAVMRGVENGYSVARSARGGFLTVSDDKGRIVAEKTSNSEPFSTLIARVSATHERTLYSLLGDWFAYVAIGILVICLGALLTTLRSKPTISA